VNIDPANGSLLAEMYHFLIKSVISQNFSAHSGVNDYPISPYAESKICQQSSITVFRWRIFEPKLTNTAIFYVLRGMT